MILFDIFNFFSRLCFHVARIPGSKISHAAFILIYLFTQTLISQLKVFSDEL